MDFVAVLFAVSGAFLTALKTNRQRFFGFVFYIIANLLWVGWAFTQDAVLWAIVAQNGIFLVPAALGAWNNRKG
jgi:hypothetical protein